MMYQPLDPPRRLRPAVVASVVLGAALLVFSLAAATPRRAATPIISAAALRRARAADGDAIVKFVENYLGEINDSVECAVPSALCDIAACTLNEDNLTASCGCQSMPADAGNPAKLAIGWSSFILAGSAIYREAVVACVDGGNCSRAAYDGLCVAIEAGTLWPSDELADSRRASANYTTSTWSTNPLYFNASSPTSGPLTCHDAMCAQCMAAPCYATRYSDDDADVFDLTCICPVRAGETCSFAQAEDRSDGGLCTEISRSEASCAASTGDLYNASTLSGAEVRDYIDAITSAGAGGGDAARCPSYGALAPVYEGRVHGT